MSRTKEEAEQNRKDLDRYCSGWRDMKHTNGAPKFSRDGTMLDDKGTRSIFDDVAD